MINQEANNTNNAEENYSPLASPVIKRDYTNHAVDGATPMQPLESPTFQIPSYNEEEEAQAEVNSKAEPEEQRTFNESFSELSGKEKSMGAEMMAEMVIDLYSKGCGYLGKIPELSETKIDRLIAEGEIEPNLTLETASGDMPIKDFAVEYNKSLSGAFEVSEEFKENVKPPLERVFKKRGLGMTDEQLLIYYFATDFGAKGVQAFMIRKTTTGILDTLKQQTQLLKEGAYRNPAPQATPNYQPQAPTAQPSTPQPIANYSNEEDLTENIAEVVSRPSPRARREPISRRRPERKAEKTNLDIQVANFAEPEEAENGVFANLTAKGGFTDSFKEPASNPQFGNVEILSGLDKVSKESPIRPMSRKSNKKPRK